MRLLRALTLCSMLVVCIRVNAEAGCVECDAVLLPTIDQRQSDYTLMQTYMSQNAEYEYDRLKNLDTNARNADASYKLFSAEYNDSNTREEFREKVRQRLANPDYSSA